MGGGVTLIVRVGLLFADHMARFMAEATATPTTSNVEDVRTSRNEGRSSGAGGTLKSTSSFRKGSAHPASPAATADEAALQRTAMRMQALRARRQERVSRDSAYIQREAAQESFARLHHKFAEAFDGQLRDFLDSLWTDSFRHHAHLAHLCVRLDYNGYYSSQFSANAPGGMGL